MPSGNVAARTRSYGFSTTEGCLVGEVIRLAVLEDHRVLGTSLAAALSAVPGIQVVGVVTTLTEARELVAREHPSIVLADAELTDHEWSLDFPLELGPTGPRVIFLSAHIRSDIVSAAVENGAAGYVHKDESLDAVVAGIRSVAAGRTAFSQQVLALVRRGPRSPTARERQVLTLLVNGSGNKEIAAALGIESRTVETHLRRLFDRYGIANRVELAVLALREGWVDARA
jgi:DNA-binding NarL/FixJ family response regulator